MELDDSDDLTNSTGITLTFAQIHIHTQDDEGSDVEQQMARVGQTQQGNKIFR